MNKVEVGSDCTVHMADKNIPRTFFYRRSFDKHQG